MIGNDLAQIVMIDDRNARYVFENALPAAKDFIKSREDLVRFGNDSLQVIRKMGVEQVEHVFRYGLPAVKDSLEASEDVKQVINGLFKMAVASGGNAKDLFKLGFPRTVELFTDEELEDYWPGLVGIAVESGKNARYVFRYGLPAVKDLIKSREDLVRIGNDLVEIADVSGEGAAYFFEGSFLVIKDLIKSREDLIQIRNDLTEIAAASGKNPGKLFQNNFFIIRELIKSRKELKQARKIIAKYDNRLKEELEDRPEEEREQYERSVTQAVASYVNHQIEKYDLNKFLSEMSEIASVLRITHDNFPLVLSALIAMDHPITRFKSLRTELPINNPLTRIIRHLGESEDRAGGYLGVTQKVSGAEGFDYLYDIILDIAKRRKKNAPQEVSGVLEVLRGIPSTEMKQWGEKGWQDFAQNIQDYYDNGFKVITKQFFNYFMKHKDDAVAIKELQEDILKELGNVDKKLNIAWGGFKGLTKTFKEKYDLSTVDELAILARYIPMANLSGRDYEGVYENLKNTLNSMKDTWRGEVDPVLRTLYTFGKTKSTIVYQAKDDKAAKEREKLHIDLINLTEKAKGDLQGIMSKHLKDPEKTDKENLKKAILTFIKGKRGINMSYLSHAPPTDSKLNEWLSKWHTILNDTWKDALRPEIDKLVDRIIKVKGPKRQEILDQTQDFLLHIFDEDITKIAEDLKSYQSLEQATEDAYYVGFFDDLLHLMAFMMTGVCTWGCRPAQVTDKRYHFGKIVVKDSSGRLHGASQVQLLKATIQGLPDKATPQGWRVLALPGINLSEGKIDLARKQAVLAMLQAAQKLAKDAGMTGAVIPTNATIHSNHGFEHKLIQELFRKGYLKEVSLSDTIILTASYPYQHVYLLQLPEDEMFITATSTDARIAEEEIAAQRFQTEAYESFSDGLGVIAYDKAISEIVPMVPVIKKAAERMTGMLPEETRKDLRRQISRDNIDFRIKIKIDPSFEKSYINKVEDGSETTLFIGKDILYESGKIDSVSFNDLFSEAVSAIILEDYQGLKEAALFNENAYFKLNIIKSLLNYRNYLENYHKLINRDTWTKENILDEKTNTQRQALVRKYEKDLDGFTRNIKDISQWTLFLNIMDGADPNAMVFNYLHILQTIQAITDQDISDIISKIKTLSVLDKTSLSALREVIKEFFYDGKVRLKFKTEEKGEWIEEKESFTHFNRQEVLETIHDTLRTTKDENEYYSTWRNLLTHLLSFTKEELNKEMNRIIDKDLFNTPERDDTLRVTLDEILTRQLGKKALTSLKTHLTAQRGFKDISYIDALKVDLNEGDNADDYEYMRRILKDGEEEIRPADWVTQLFFMKSQDVLEPPDESVGLSLGVQKDYAEKLQSMVGIHWNYLPEETQWILTEFGVTDDVVEMTRKSGENSEKRKRLFNNGIPKLINVFPPGDFKEFWPELVQIAIASEENAEYVFADTIPAIEELIISREDLKRIGNDLVQMGKASGRYSETLFSLAIPEAVEFFPPEDLEERWPVLVRMVVSSGENADELIREGLPTVMELFTPEEFKDYWPDLAQMAITSGENAFYLFQSSFPLVKDFIKSQEDLKQIGDDLVRIAIENPKDGLAIFAIWLPAVKKYITSREDLNQIANIVIQINKVIKDSSVMEREDIYDVAIPWFVNRFSLEDFNKYWPDIAYIVTEGSEYIYSIFESAYPTVQELSKSSEDLINIGKNLAKLFKTKGKDAVHFFDTEFPEIEEKFNDRNLSVFRPHLLQLATERTFDDDDIFGEADAFEGDIDTESDDATYDSLVVYKILEHSKFKQSWPNIFMRTHLDSSLDSYTVFRYGFPAAIDLIKSPEDVDQILNDFNKIAGAVSGKHLDALFSYGFPAVSKFIQSREDLQRIGNVLVQMANKGGKKAFQNDFSLIEALIKSRKDFNEGRKSMTKLNKTIEAELADKPEEEREQYAESITQAVGTYAMHFAERHGFTSLPPELGEIASVLKLTHDNLPLFLSPHLNGE